MNGFEICMSNLKAMRGQAWQSEGVTDRYLNDLNSVSGRYLPMIPGRITDEGVMALHALEMAVAFPNQGAWA